MADLSNALFERLRDDPTLDPLVGTKIYWMKVPQGTVPPYIRLQIVGGDAVEDLDGDTVLHETRVQADCFATTHAESHEIAEAITRSTAEPATTAGVVFGRIKTTTPRDLGEDVPGKGFIHRASMDLLVSYRLA
jgi:hypothetical protein